MGVHRHFFREQRRKHVVLPRGEVTAPAELVRQENGQEWCELTTRIDRLRVESMVAGMGVTATRHQISARTTWSRRRRAVAARWAQWTSLERVAVVPQSEKRVASSYLAARRRTAVEGVAVRGDAGAQDARRDAGVGQLFSSGKCLQLGTLIDSTMKGSLTQ
jgi:hypothetical protein|tara:strand:- start:60 stop:545 length:486 start_codon:yes stop_codon:yes gene_type:complete